MITAHRNGGSMVFRDRAGQHLGTIVIVDLGALVAAGSQVPVQSIDGQAGHARRSKQTVVVTINGQTYHAPWHEFRNCAMLIGSSVALTGNEKEVQSLPSRVTQPCPKSAPELVNTPGSTRKYEVIPPKKLKPRPSPSPSSFVRQSYRKIPAAGGV